MDGFIKVYVDYKDGSQEIVWVKTLKEIKHSDKIAKITPQ